jgi:putative endonuclease
MGYSVMAARLILVQFVRVQILVPQPYLKDGLLYTGFTDDLRNRIKKHENGFVISTKHRRPLKLIYYEAYLLESDAKRRERYLKGGNGKENLKTQLKNYFNKNEWKTSPLS